MPLGARSDRTAGVIAIIVVRMLAYIAPSVMSVRVLGAPLSRYTKRTHPAQRGDDRDRQRPQDRVRARNGASPPEGQGGWRRRAPAHGRAEERDRRGPPRLRGEGGRAGDPTPRRAATGKEPRGGPEAQRRARAGPRSVRSRPGPEDRRHPGTSELIPAG